MCSRENLAEQWIKSGEAPHQGIWCRGLTAVWKQCLYKQKLKAGPPKKKFLSLFLLLGLLLPAPFIFGLKSPLELETRLPQAVRLFLGRSFKTCFWADSSLRVKLGRNLQLSHCKKSITLKNLSFPTMSNVYLLTSFFLRSSACIRHRSATHRYRKCTWRSVYTCIIFWLQMP